MSLKAWYPFNGNVNNQGCGDAELTQTTAPTFVNNGKIGKALNAGGFKWKASQTAKILNNKTVSICFWIYVNADTGSTTNRSMVFGNDSMSSGGGRQYSLFQYPTCNDLHFSWQNCNSGTYTTVFGGVATGVLKSKEWTHVAVVYDNPNLKIYINGVLKQTATGVINTDSYEFDTQVIWSSTYHYLNDYRVYDHALSAKEVKEISKGLVLHYKLSDTYLENTTNLYSAWSTNCYNGATSKYNYGTTTDIYNTITDGIVKITTGTFGLACYPYIFFNNITPAIGSKRTLSFDYFPSVLNTVVFYSYSTSGNITYVVNGTNGTGGTIPVKVGEWNHLEVTIENTGTTTSGFGYMRIGSANHTSDTQNYWLFKNIQIEDKDYATGYIPSGSTRPAKTIETDCSGFFYNGNILGECKSNANGGRYNHSVQLDGVNSVIKLPFNTIIPTSGDGIFTMNMWFYHTDEWSTKTWETLFGGPSGFELSSKNGSTNSPLIYAYSWGKGTKAYTLNEWHMITMVRTPNDAKFYLDGELAITGTAGTLPSGSYFIGAWSSQTGQNYKGLVNDFRIYSTALSADDIKELYSVKASIDKKGNLFCGEVVEE